MTGWLGWHLLDHDWRDFWNYHGRVRLISTGAAFATEPRRELVIHGDATRSLSNQGLDAFVDLSLQGGGGSTARLSTAVVLLQPIVQATSPAAPEHRGSIYSSWEPQCARSSRNAAA